MQAKQCSPNQKTLSPVNNRSYHREVQPGKRVSFSDKAKRQSPHRQPQQKRQVELEANRGLEQVYWHLEREQMQRTHSNRQEKSQRRLYKGVEDSILSRGAEGGAGEGLSFVDGRWVRDV
jgi:membrane carboxypeptidase/penicillin-binding protein PbpC